jgi:hypothetical protein
VEHWLAPDFRTVDAWREFMEPHASINKCEYNSKDAGLYAPIPTPAFRNLPLLNRDKMDFNGFKDGFWSVLSKNNVHQRLSVIKKCF